LLRFIEAEGQLLNLSVFFIFGVLVAGLIQPLGWEVALYGLLSLTLIHVLPVAASLVGTGPCGASVALMGWVGPRGGPNLSPTVVFSSFISTLIPLVVEVVDPACYASIPS
jgi:hypothetical protein